MYELKINLNESSIEDLEADLLHIAEKIKQQSFILETEQQLKGYGWNIINYNEEE